MSFKVVLIHTCDTTLSYNGVAFLRERGVQVAEGDTLYDIPRHHPAFVAMAEELGEMAFEAVEGDDISIREVDRVTRYQIDRDWDTNIETLVLEYLSEWIDPTQF